MKTIMIIAIVLLFGTLCICEANPIVTRVVRPPYWPGEPEPTPNPPDTDYPAVLLSLAGVIYVESLILLGLLRDVRVLWACPYTNAVSTIPGFFLFGKLCPNESASTLTLACIILGCFVVSVLIESSLTIAVVKKLPLIKTLIGIFLANTVTYLLIVALLPLGFFHLTL